MGQPPFDLLFDDEHSEFWSNIVWQHAGDVLSGLVPFDHIYPLVAFAGEEYVPFYWSINQPKKDIYHNNLSQKGFRKHLSHPPLVVNFFVLRQLLSLLPSHSWCSCECVYFSKPGREASQEFLNKDVFRNILQEPPPLWEGTNDSWPIFPSNRWSERMLSTMTSKGHGKSAQKTSHSFITHSRHGLPLCFAEMGRKNLKKLHQNTQHMYLALSEMKCTLKL